MSDACKMAAIAVSSIVGTLALSVGVFAFYDKYLRNSPDGKNLKPGTSDVDKLQNSYEKKVSDLMGKTNIERYFGCGKQRAFTCWAHSSGTIVNWFSDTPENPIKDTKDVFKLCPEATGYSSICELNEKGQLVLKGDMRNALPSILEQVVARLPEYDRNYKMLGTMCRDIEDRIYNNIFGQFYAAEEIRNILVKNHIQSEALSCAANDKDTCAHGVKLFLDDYFGEDGPKKKPPIAVLVDGNHWINIMSRSGKDFLVCDSEYSGYRVESLESLAYRMSVEDIENQSGTYAFNMVIPRGKVAADEEIHLNNSRDFDISSGGYYPSQEIRDVVVQIPGQPVSAVAQVYETAWGKKFVLKQDGTKIIKNDNESMGDFVARVRDEKLVINKSVPAMPANNAKAWVRYQVNTGTTENPRMKAKGIKYYDNIYNGETKFLLIPLDINDIDKYVFDTEDELVSFVRGETLHNGENFADAPLVGRDDVGANGQLENLTESEINDGVREKV